MGFVGGYLQGYEPRWRVNLLFHKPNRFPIYKLHIAVIFKFPVVFAEGILWQLPNYEHGGLYFKWLHSPILGAELHSHQCGDEKANLDILNSLLLDLMLQ